MLWNFLYLIPPVYFAALITSVAGFGSGFVLAPIISTFFPLKEAIGLSTAIFIFSSGGKTLYYRNHIDFKGWKLIMLSGIPGIFIGTQVLRIMKAEIVEFSFGVLLLALSLYIILRRNSEMLFFIPKRQLHFVFGFTGGILSGTFHASGPLLVALMRARNSDRTTTVGTVALSHFSFNLLKLPLFIKGGVAPPRLIPYFLLLIPFTLIGIYTGRWVLKEKMKERHFEIAVSILMICLGINLIRSSLL